MFINSLNQIGAEYLNAFSRYCRALLTRASDPSAEGFPPAKEIAVDLVVQATELLSIYFAPRTEQGGNKLVHHRRQLILAEYLFNLGLVADKLCVDDRLHALHQQVK